MMIIADFQLAEIERLVRAGIESLYGDPSTLSEEDLLLTERAYNLLLDEHVAAGGQQHQLPFATYTRHPLPDGEVVRPKNEIWSLVQKADREYDQAVGDGPLMFLTQGQRYRQAFALGIIGALGWVTGGASPYPDER